jgi:hypothetical protein
MKAREFIPPDNSKILKLTSGLSNMMLFRNKMRTKFVINNRLPILISFNIIQTTEGRNCKLTFSKRITITACVLLIRATMTVASYTLPIWSMWMAWKLLVHLLVITVRLSWWWAWMLEGLLIVHILLLIMVVVVLTCIIQKLVLIYSW